MPYFDVYVGKQKFALYMKDKPADAYMKGDLSKVYGTIRYVYNTDSQTFTVSLTNLNDRAKYLIGKGYLCIAAEIKDNCRHYSGKWRSKRRIPAGRQNAHWISRRVCNMYRDTRWFCPRSSQCMRRATDTHIKVIPSASSSITFSLKNDILPIMPRMLKRTLTSAYISAQPSNYYDVKFYLYSTRGNGRFHKTECESFRLAYL